MDISVLFRFDGRIDRKTWWLGTIALAVVSLGLQPVLSRVFHTTARDLMDAGQRSRWDFLPELLDRLAWQQLIMTALLAWPATALLMQRLNDRDRPRGLIAVFWAPTLAMVGMMMANLAFTVDRASLLGPVVTPTEAYIFARCLSIAVGVWAVVELGFLRGTYGQNRYGPDPLQV